MAKRIHRIPDTTNNAMICPEFQVYRVPPKLTAMTKVMNAPILRIVPIQSNGASFSQAVFPGAGLLDGITNRYVGRRMAPKRRLM